jgi:hypothetical protein
MARLRHVQLVDHIDHIDLVDGVGPAERVDTVDEEFLALVCSDSEWLRAEFDAIIAAAWSSPPPACPGNGQAATQPEKAVGSTSPAGPVRPRRSGYPVRDHADRTRSPPDARPQW